jgi:glycosyltransferase involved in cell wall biosynthesis
MIRWLLMATQVPAEGSGGGIVRYTVELARALAQRTDVELHILSGRDAIPFWTRMVPGDQIHPVPNLPTTVLGMYERYGYHRIFQAPWDVVQGTKHLLPRRSRGRQVLTVHDLLPLDRPGDFNAAKRHLLPQPFLASVAGADRVISVSAATAARVNSYLPEVSERIRVVPLANETVGLTAAPEAIPELAGQQFALVVGDANYRKNLPLVVDAWPAVRREVPDARLAVVGPTAWGATKTHSGKQVDPNVHFLHQVPDAQLRWAYEQAAVTLCPAILEGFGLPSVEALRLGSPVITSEDPALCEASGLHGNHLSALEPERWERTIIDYLQQPRPKASLAVRTWQEVAAETVQAVLT